MGGPLGSSRSPLDLKGATVTVRAKGDSFILDISSSDDRAARMIVARARALRRHRAWLAVAKGVTGTPIQRHRCVHDDRPHIESPEEEDMAHTSNKTSERHLRSPETPPNRDEKWKTTPSTETTSDGGENARLTREHARDENAPPKSASKK
jgi:hypothetical protein